MQVPRPDLDTVLSTLTPREREVVGLVAAGRPNKVIAIDLGISLRTAEAHRARIFTKLDARNAMELACRLCAHGRSGASPILNAAAVRTDQPHDVAPNPADAAKSDPGRAASDPPPGYPNTPMAQAAHLVLHEYSRAYGALPLGPPGRPISAGPPGPSAPAAADHD